MDRFDIFNAQMQAATDDIVNGEPVEARLWDSESRQSPYSTVADPDDEGCEVCYADDCECGANN